ncbi:kinase-like domain-containing protein [Collybia nuda]|uniref:Kinase-like domain-containing protein n=1 Tax=Collybia nuda TaxID=64659 RepID=A0A9P5YA24_9AGAR|nr:kinase-like domain-containing protein [Collybia nuda]
MSDSLLSEHEDLMIKANVSRSSRLFLSRAAHDKVSEHGGISSQSTLSTNSIASNVGLGNLNLWGAVIEEGKPTSSENVQGKCEAGSISQAFGQYNFIAHDLQVGLGGDTLIDRDIRICQNRQVAEILSRLGAVFSDERKYQLFMECQRSDSQIQSLIDLFQMLLDVPTLETKFRSQLLAATRNLATIVDFYPTCSRLRSVELVASHPLAGGSFANIYKGIFEGQYVCMKVIRLYQPFQVRYFLQRLYSEVILWKQLKHENLLPFYGVYKLGNQLCLVSHWADNGDIKSFLEINPYVNRVSLSLDVAKGIAYLHENNIIHGDLKGGNVLVHSTGRAVISDVGLSAVTDPQILKWTSHSCGTSQGGAIRWQAPELYGMEGGESMSQSKASDIYALGCVFYEIFTGQVPFAEYRMDSTVMHKVCLGKKPSKPVPLAPSWSEWGLTEPIWRLMEDCWTRSPATRPTIEQIIVRLDGEVIGVDERLISREVVSPSHLRQGIGHKHPDYPTVDELETCLWGTPVGVSHSEWRTDL